MDCLQVAYVFSSTLLCKGLKAISVLGCIGTLFVAQRSTFSQKINMENVI